MLGGGLGLYMYNPQHFIDQKYKNLKVKASEEAKIPYIVHHIWLTHRDSPREVREQDIKNAIATKETFAKGKGKWQHIVWMNDPSLIPDSVKALEVAGIEVKSIYDYEEDLKLFYLVEELIEKKDWGKATDTLRYALVQKFGGVYADINFIFNRDVTEEAHKYNFFSITFGGLYIDNFFFGCSPRHPVIEKVLQLVERNLMDPPEYLASIAKADPESRVLTDMGTANPTYLAYYAEANKEGNIDVIYPLSRGGIFGNREDAPFSHGTFSNADYERGSEEATDRTQDEELESMENIRPICSEGQLVYDLMNAVDLYELCAADALDIGHDSSDGQTWLQK